jgi:diguanylate cyclase (GGDEF)-like protein/putative nucleotidyltransferase with HDIG domain
MKELPSPARWLLHIVYALGAVSLLVTYGAGFPGVFSGIQIGENLRSPLLDGAEFILFLLLGILSGGKKVVLLRLKYKEDVGSMSLGFAVIFAALIRFGAPVALLVGLSSTLASCVYPKRFPWYQTHYNLSVNAIQITCAGIVMFYLNGRSLQITGIETITAIVAAAFTYFAINTGLISAIIALTTGKGARNIPAVWHETFLWTAPSYFLGAGVSSLMVLVMRQSMALTLMCAVVVAYFTHASYRRYMERADALVASKDRLAELYLATVRSLALAIDAKDQFTHQHILRVQQYAVAIARQMGLTGDDLTAIETSALLHDIGKLGVPEYVLLKPGRLTDEEFAKIKEHPRIGADILDPVPFPWPVLPGVKHHHEKWDGTGYPDGLAGEAIPLQGRILAVADVYDALTSNRSYRNAWTHEKAVQEIKAGAGTHFDPRIVEAFLEVIDTVVNEMAAEGIGPKAVATSGAPPQGVTVATTRADVAARDIQRAASELWALYEVAQTLSSSLGLKETLDILARKIAAIMPDIGCLFLLRENTDPEGRSFDGSDVGAAELFQVRAAVGINHTYFTNGRTSHANSLSVKVARERTTYLGVFDVEDLSLVSQPGQTISSLPWMPFSTALIVPIVHQGTVLGTINLYHTQPGAFSQHDRQLLEMIAERAAMAIYNGLLFDRTLCDAMTDPLTGIANIRFLTEHLARRSARENRQTFTLLCLDLDSFKPINDNFGHQQGDRALRELSALFRRTVRAEDIVVRYGGDEFLILLEDLDRDAARAVEMRLREAVSQYDTGLYHPRIGAIHLGVSIGMAAYPADGDDAATLISIADSRMYQDKAESKLRRLINAGPNPPDSPPTEVRTNYTRVTDTLLSVAALPTPVSDSREICKEARLPVLAGVQEEKRCLY